MRTEVELHQLVIKNIKSTSAGLLSSYVTSCLQEQCHVLITFFFQDLNRAHTKTII